MSVTLTPWSMSNPRVKPGVITVLVIIVITWSVAADIVGAYADTLAVTAALFAEARYSSGVQQPR